MKGDPSEFGRTDRLRAYITPRHFLLSVRFPYIDGSVFAPWTLGRR